MGAPTAEELAVENFSEPGTLTRPIFGPDLASAIAMSGITNRYHRVSGTAQMTTIALPYTGFAGKVSFIPTAAFTGATGGAAGTAIGLAFTAVIGKVLDLVYNPITGLWYPSYVA